MRISTSLPEGEWREVADIVADVESSDVFLLALWIGD
jgi:hypothetical protein